MAERLAVRHYVRHQETGRRNDAEAPEGGAGFFMSGAGAPSSRLGTGLGGER